MDKCDAWTVIYCWRFKQYKLNRPPSIKIINPNLEIEERYKKVFNSNNVSKNIRLFSQYCNWINNVFEGYVINICIDNPKY